MRITVFILGLLLGAVMVVGVLLDLGTKGEARDSAAGGGLIMAFLWLCACVVVLRLPRAAAILFAIAGAIGLRLQDATGNLGIWGGVSLVLAALAYIGWKDKRRDEIKERTRDDLLRQIAVNQSHGPGGPPPAP